MSNQVVERVIVKAYFDHPRQPGDTLEIALDNPMTPESAKVESQLFTENIRLGNITEWVDRANKRTFYLPASSFRGLIAYSVFVDTEDLVRRGLA